MHIHKGEIMAVFVTPRDDGKPVVVGMCAQRNTTVASGIPGITIESTCDVFALKQKYDGEKNPECLHCVYWWGGDLEEIMRSYEATWEGTEKRIREKITVPAIQTRRSRFEGIIE
jgi:hypothetical protein